VRLFGRALLLLAGLFCGTCPRGARQLDPLAHRHAARNVDESHGSYMAVTCKTRVIRMDGLYLANWHAEREIALLAPHENLLAIHELPEQEAPLIAPLPCFRGDTESE